jgi:hypothetical protein
MQVLGGNASLSDVILAHNTLGVDVVSRRTASCRGA